jgi:penicillin-binding protein 1C
MTHGRFRRWALRAALGPALGSAAVCVWLAAPLPRDMMAPPPTVARLQDRHGLPLRGTRTPSGVRGGTVGLEDVDPKLIQAFLASEDQRFLQHHGVDLSAVLRAARDDAMRGRIVSGASTLTMQTVRLLHPVPRTWAGKVVQALWALRLELHQDKAWILEQYLNRVPLGQGTRGVAAAAALYFCTSPAHLSLGQAALLAGLARTPARDNPFAAPDGARRRRRQVLQRLAADGWALPGDVRRAEGEPVRFGDCGGVFRAPHFTTWALDRPMPPVTRQLDGTGDDVVRTTLDLQLQTALEDEVRHTVTTLQGENVRQAAVVVLDNASGGVLAWVGSPDFWADTMGQVDMVATPRQPGSALKPFLYGLAFEHGYTTSTVLPDVPHTYATPTGPYRPRDYDRTFRGPVRARVALASSLNVPAVELADRLGPAALLATLHDAGFASLDRPAAHYGVGLALGNGEVTLLELANAYRGLAVGGVLQPVTWRLDQIPDAPHRFLSPGAAALVLDVLADPVARVPGFGTHTPLDFPFPAAAKTGTSRHFTDNWAVAATAGFTVAVWVGNFSGAPMKAVSGITGAGPLLHRAVLATARRYPPGQLVRPDQVGAVALPVCALSGMRAASGCASVVDWFLPGTEPPPDTWEVGGHPHLPPEYAEWLASRPPEQADAGVIADADETRSGGNAHHGPAAPKPAAATVLSPRDGDAYEVPPGVDPRFATLSLVAAGPPGESVRWFVDGRPIPGARWRIRPGHHTITALWASGQADSVRVRVNTGVGQR